MASEENDIVLDAFCGCGTALVAAENLNRQWIGIDLSPTACRVMAKRLRDVCHVKEDDKLRQIGRGFVVRDLPWTEDKLRKIPPFEFENWAVIARKLTVQTFTELWGTGKGILVSVAAKVLSDLATGKLP